MDAVTILRRARKRVSDPGRWTQGQMARKPTGTGVTAKNPEACRWCAVGAIRKAAPTERRSDRAHRLLSTASHELFGVGPIQVNDGRRGTGKDPRAVAHQATLLVFDRAIELAKAEQR